MSLEEIRKRAEKIRLLIEYHRRNYHVYDKSEISPEALDSLKHELAEIEAKHPELITPDSPTQRVAGGVKDELSKVRHKVKQWSLNDCFTPEEFKDFDLRVKRLLGLNLESDMPYVCEHKIDGLKIILEYKNGLLVQGSTRGDGVVGEDVTHNIKTIDSVPLRLSKPVDIIVEGEVWMKKSVFESLNKERAKKGEELFANSRNIAAGSVRQLDSKIARSRRLDTFIYDITFLSQTPNFQDDELKLLSELGFKVNKNFKLCRNRDEVIKYWEHWEQRKGKEDYNFDGIVVKVRDKKVQDKLGHTGKAPRYAIAFKFKAEQTTTEVLGISFQVGRTGVVTPVAELKPTLVYGSTVSRATLHNEDEIKRLDLRIGDTVILQKAGDVIPEVVEVLKDLRKDKSKPFKMIEECPVCDFRLQKKIIGERDKESEKSAAWYCTNKNCPAKDRRKLYYFTSKKVFNIDGLGPKIIDCLCDNGLVRIPADFFKLNRAKLLELPRFAEKSVDNLLESIDKARSVELSRLIASLGIPQVGEETAYDLAESFGSIDKFLKASEEELASLFGVGKVIGREISEWRKDKLNIQNLEKLLKELKVINPQKVKKEINKKIFGKSFVLTGTMGSMDRDEAKQRIKALGGDVGSSVSKNTDYLVVGENAGSKLDKAKELGVTIINEKEFLDLFS